MEILLLLGIYCVELVCYQVVLKILFQVEVRNRTVSYTHLTLPTTPYV